MRIVLRIGPPSYTILVRSCVSLCDTQERTSLDITSVCGNIPIEIPILWPRAVMVGPRPRAVMVGPRPHVVMVGPRPHAVMLGPRPRAVMVGPRPRVLLTPPLLLFPSLHPVYYCFPKSVPKNFGFRREGP